MNSQIKMKELMKKPHERGREDSDNTISDYLTTLNFQALWNPPPPQVYQVSYAPVQANRAIAMIYLVSIHRIKKCYKQATNGRHARVLGTPQYSLCFRANMPN
jgi:hypothetical protein